MHHASTGGLLRSLFRPIFGFLFFFLLPPAFADELREIVVSASPGEEEADRFPSGVSIRRDQEIAPQGDLNLAQILDSIPNLQAVGGTSRPRFFQIRGIGELEQYEGAPNPSVGYILDDLDLSGLGVATSLFDVDQVEVLRGPQGVGHGASALAGVVSVRSKDPTPYATTHGHFSVGSDFLHEIGAAVSGPLDGSDGSLLARLSVFEHYQNGFRRNEFLDRDDTNQRDELTGRAKLRWLASNEVTLDLSALRVDQNNGYDAFAIDNSRVTQSDKPGKDASLLNGGTLKATYEPAPGTALTSATSLSDVDSTYSYDGDWGNDLFWQPFAPYDYFSDTGRERRTVGQEFKWAEGKGSAGPRHVVGVSLKRLDENAAIRERASGELYDALDSEFRQTRLAVFGERTTPLSEAWDLVSGLRLERHRSEYDDTQGSSFSPQDSLWGGLLGLTHELSDLHTGYTSLARGFKGGGFNPGSAVPTDLRGYDPESLTTIEAGVRSKLLDGSLHTSLGAFLGFRRDQQARFAFQADPSDPLTFVYLTDNAAEGRTKGVEAEATWKVTSRVMLHGSGSLLRSKFESYDNPLGIDLAGRDTAHSPNWQYSTSVEYLVSENLYTRLNASGRDGYYFDDSHNERNGTANFLGAELGWREDTWAVSLWGRNVLDERHAVRGFFFGNEPPDFPSKLYVQRGDPAQFGVTLTVYL